MTYFRFNRLGKVLFPHLSRDQRKNQMATIRLVLLFSLLLAVTVATVIIKTARH